MTTKHREDPYAVVPAWSPAELEEIQTQSPVVFPLPEPDDASRHAMEKVWRRHLLERYLRRWDNAYVPDVPEAFWSFGWRACDVGSGFGLFSIQESGRHPERAYLAIDKGTRRGSKMAARFAAIDRPNLLGLHGNAIPVLGRMPDQSLDLITLFYPNPWWPAKHRKKRWAYHPLLPKMVTLLKPGGEIWLCSNECFPLSEWRYAMTHHPEVADRVEESYVGPVTVTAEDARSHFESKLLLSGTACGEIRFRKRGAD